MDVQELEKQQRGVMKALMVEVEVPLLMVPAVLPEENGLICTIMCIYCTAESRR